MTELYQGDRGDEMEERSDWREDAERDIKECRKTLYDAFMADPESCPQE